MKDKSLTTLDDLAASINSLESRVDSKIESLAGSIRSLDEKLDSRTDELKQLITASQDETAELITDVLELVDERTSKLEAGQNETNLRLKNLDLRTDSLDIRMSHIEVARA